MNDGPLPSTVFRKGCPSELDRHTSVTLDKRQNGLPFPGHLLPLGRPGLGHSTVLTVSNADFWTFETKPVVDVSFLNPVRQMRVEGARRRFA